MAFSRFPVVVNDAGRFWIVETDGNLLELWRIRTSVLNEPASANMFRGSRPAQIRFKPFAAACALPPFTLTYQNLQEIHTQITR